MHEALSVITKKLIAQNLPYFYQNSLKIFINLNDCWKKYGNYVIHLWKFMHLLPMSQGCALLISGSKGQR